MSLCGCMVQGVSLCGCDVKDVGDRKTAFPQYYHARLEGENLIAFKPALVV